MTQPVQLPAGKRILATDFDAYENLTGLWVDYSGLLAWTAATANPAIGNGVIGAKYVRAGKFVTYTGRIVMGSTTTFGTGDWRISLPVTAAGGSASATGSGLLLDASTPGNSRPAGAELLTASTIRFYSTTGRVDAANPFAWAVSDELRWSITYEAA